MKAAFCLIICIILFIACEAQDGCSGTPNLNPIWTEDPVFVSQVQNGKLYKVGNVSPQISVVHVYGTPYEMGYAHGALLKDTIVPLMDQVWDYIYSQIQQYLSDLPPELAYLFEEYGVGAVLEATYLLTAEFIPDYFMDELRGMGDATGIDYMQLVRIHMLPELIQAHCSMVGAWGPAIKGTNGTLFQMRSLDWDTSGPYQQAPVVIVYHPKDLGHNFALLTWAGFIGALTGYSSAEMGICEKVWISYNGTQSRIGIPFHFLLRDILQFDRDIDDSLSRIANADRTCSIWIGLGDTKINQFRTVQYSFEQVNIFDDQTFPEYPGHPRFDGLVYVDKHEQPSSNPCLGELMTKYYGSLDAVTLLRYVTAVHQTGDMNIGIYDFANHFMYVSNAAPYDPKGFALAYDRPFIRLNMAKLFNEQL